MKKEWATPEIKKLSFAKTESGISGINEAGMYTGASYKSGS